jgi:hypothetical protein
MFDMLGREVLRKEDVSASMKYESVLHVAKAVPGTYYLFITSGESSWVRSVRVW